MDEEEVRDWLRAGRHRSAWLSAAVRLSGLSWFERRAPAGVTKFSAQPVELPVCLRGPFNMARRQ